MTTTPTITGAELQTMREACNLSRTDLALLIQVSADDIAEWEGEQTVIPSRTAHVIAQLDKMVHIGVDAGIKAMKRSIATNRKGKTPKEYTLLRYRSHADLVRFEPIFQDVPNEIHGAIVTRFRDAMRHTPGLDTLTIRVIWMEPEAYEAWRNACQLPNNDTTRSAWAAQQIAAKATTYSA